MADRLGDRTTSVLLLDGGVAPEPSRLLRPAIIGALFKIQLRRLQRTWTDIDRYTAIATGGRAVPRLTWERVEANHATMLSTRRPPGPSVTCRPDRPIRETENGCGDSP